MYAVTTECILLFVAITSAFFVSFIESLSICMGYCLTICSGAAFSGQEMPFKSSIYLEVESALGSLNAESKLLRFLIYILAEVNTFHLFTISHTSQTLVYIQGYILQ